MADEFRDAIAAAHVWRDDAYNPEDYYCGPDMADEILALPEMEAIRQALLETNYAAWTELKEKFPSIARWVIP